MYAIAFILAFFINGGLPSSEEVAESFVEHLQESVGTRGEEGYSQEELEYAKSCFMSELLARSSGEESGEELEAYLYSERSIQTITLKEVNETAHHAKKSVELQRFLKLPFSREDEKTIYKIISTVGEKNIFALLFEKSELKRKGKEIEHLHPLRFLGAIFSNYHLKVCMRDVGKSTFKWDGFMDGLVPRMKDEDRLGNLLPYVKGFCEYLKVDEERVTHLIRQRNWDGLVRYLL